jgi:glycolate oxidase FAD binding subunit
MSNTVVFLDALQQQVPAVFTSAEVETLRQYAVDGIQPLLVTTPSTVEEVSEVVGLANRHHLKVLAHGSGWHMNLGGLPDHIDILLSTHKLTHILEHEAPDMTCHVEAGITLASLQTQLAAKGQRLSLDPPGKEQITLGGLLATNASGPRRLRYGAARDLVIGLRVVQANGDIARSGGRVVKNVAGYDLNKLYIGSMGTLGIIVEANLKLHPLPSAERTLLLAFTNAEDAIRTVAAILGSQLIPSALELIDAAAATDMADFFGLNLPTNGYTLAVNFEGGVSAIARQVDETRLLARSQGALLGDELEGDEQENFWNAVREHTQGALSCKVALLVTQVASYLRLLSQICQRHDIEAATVTHAGNGVIYVELRPNDATPRLVAAIAELRLHAQEARGSLVVERCPVDLKHSISIWGEPKGEFPMMQRLKQQFDPTGTFVTGRFLGGL